MNIYEILSERDSQTGLLYKIWWVDVDFPIPGNFTKIAPPKEAEKEKFDFMSNSWVEDTELIEKTKINNLELGLSESNRRVDVLENALLELLMMKASEV